MKLTGLLSMLLLASIFIIGCGEKVVEAEDEVTDAPTAAESAPADSGKEGAAPVNMAPVPPPQGD